MFFVAGFMCDITVCIDVIYVCFVYGRKLLYCKNVAECHTIDCNFTQHSYSTWLLCVHMYYVVMQSVFGLLNELKCIQFY